jgi:AraC-like DNA-binding protein
MPHLSPHSPGHRLRASFLEDLADSAQMVRMFEHIPGVSFFAKNRSCQLMLGNSHFYKRFGFNDESDVVGRTDYDLFPRPLADKFRADDEHVLTSGEPLLHIVELFLNQQGIPDWFITQKLPLFGKSGHVVGLMGAIQRYEVHRSISAADAPIAKAANAFRREPGQRWRMEEVARSVGLSQRQFDRKFHECYGVTPQHYLMKTRIQASCALLRVTGATIAEVAGHVGFYDQSAFTSQFRRQMGITPRRYQTQYCG